jgi:hypothetical protein
MRVIFLVLILLATMESCSRKFDKTDWLYNSDLSKTRNPRAKMTKDLMQNHLRPGMKRGSIISLLGQPYIERIEDGLPKGLKVPDSLLNKRIEKSYDWYSKHSQRFIIMRYPIDLRSNIPYFLAIKLGQDSTVIDFEIH